MRLPFNLYCLPQLQTDVLLINNSHSEFLQLATERLKIRNCYNFDLRYPLRPYLMTPFAEPQNDSQERFNVWQKSTRATVETTIGILKQRWR